MQVGGVMSSTHRAFDAQTDVEHVVKQPLRRERRERLTSTGGAHYSCSCPCSDSESNALQALQIGVDKGE